MVEAVRRGVEVLQDHGVEGGELLGEELVDGEGDERQLVGAGLHLAVVGAQDEEGHHVDGGVALQPHAQRAHVVGGAAGDVEDAHPIAADVDGDEAPVVLRDLVALGGLDGDLEDARAGALDGHRELDGGLAGGDVGHALGERHRLALVAQLARDHRDVAAGEAAVAADLDAQRERLVRHGGARGEHPADAGVAGRALGERRPCGRGSRAARARRAWPRPAAVSPGRSSRPSESTTMAAGRSSAARAIDSSAAPRSDPSTGCTRNAGLPSAPARRRAGRRPSGMPACMPASRTGRRAVAEAVEREPHLARRACRARRGRAPGSAAACPSRPGRSMDREASASTTTSGPDQAALGDDRHRPQHRREQAQRRQHAARRDADAPPAPAPETRCARKSSTARSTTPRAARRQATITAGEPEIARERERPDHGSPAWRRLRKLSWTRSSL